MPLPDDLDGCQAVLEWGLYDDEETQALRPLFPGDLDVDVEELAAQWRELFADGIPEPIPGVTDQLKVIGFEDPFNDPDDPATWLEWRVAVARAEDELAALRRYGLKVTEIAGWRTRGGFPFRPRGHLDHHTAGGPSGDAGSLGICINGRSDLPGPLCQTLQGRSNTIYLIAAGRANHAGSGGWRGLVGNGSVTGNERENRGTSIEPWRPDQHEAAARVAAAYLEAAGSSVDLYCRHAEWAPGRKPDSHTVTGNHLRSLCAAIMATGGAPGLSPADRALFERLSGECRSTVGVLVG